MRSTNNKQRIHKEGGVFHFFLRRFAGIKPSGFATADPDLTPLKEERNEVFENDCVHSKKFFFEKMDAMMLCTLANMNLSTEARLAHLKEVGRK